MKMMQIHSDYVELLHSRRQWIGPTRRRRRSSSHRLPFPLQTKEDVMRHIVPAIDLLPLSWPHFPPFATWTAKTPYSFVASCKLISWSREKASCMARTANSRYLDRITMEILISVVEIMRTLMFSRARTPNICAATPAWERIPTPTRETLVISV